MKKAVSTDLTFVERRGCGSIQNQAGSSGGNETAVSTDLAFVAKNGGCGCGCNGKPVIYRSVWDRLCLQLFGAMPPGMDPASQLEDIAVWTDGITLVSDAGPYSFTVETHCTPGPAAQDFIQYKDKFYVIGSVTQTSAYEYSCTNCQPIDESIIAAYIALVNTNEYANGAEQERARNESERIANERLRQSAEDERVRQAASDHGIAASDHQTAANDHQTAANDHRIATEDHDYISQYDLSQFITKTVDDLVNYYKKSETYTQAEVRALIAAINQFHYEVYPSLSQVTNPANNVLYLIGPTGSGADKYEEYVYDSTKPVAERWVKIGDTSIDLSGYVTTEALSAALANKQDKLVSGTNIKTINGTSVLGSGNLKVEEPFIYVHGTTSFNDLETAYNAKMVIFARYNNNSKDLYVFGSRGEQTLNPIPQITVTVIRYSFFRIVCQLDNSKYLELLDLTKISQTGQPDSISASKTTITFPTNLSDLADDSTHRLVTDSEKATWNGKQNAISVEYGGMSRNNVSGTGNITIANTRGEFPTIVEAGDYDVVVEMQSDTQNYSLNVTFGSNTYTLTAVDGIISDKRTLTLAANDTWSASLTGTVASGTLIDVSVRKGVLDAASLVAKTGSYTDLSNKPTIPTVESMTAQEVATAVASAWTTVMGS